MLKEISDTYAIIVVGQYYRYYWYNPLTGEKRYTDDPVRWEVFEVEMLFVNGQWRYNRMTQFRDWGHLPGE